MSIGNFILLELKVMRHYSLYLETNQRKQIAYKDEFLPRPALLLSLSNL